MTMGISWGYHQLISYELDHFPITGKDMDG